MLQRLTEEALRSCFLIEFRNLPDARFGYRSFRSCSYFPINWLRVRNSLHDTPRTEVRFIKEFAHMLHHVYSWKIRRHFPSREFFRQLALQATDPQRQSRIFIVTYKNKIIGGSACIYSGDNAYLWFSGGMRKTYALQYPGVLAVWKALDDARQQGYRHLEFLDVGLPFRHHGYREFVLRFGGKQISTRRWFRFRWKWLNRVLTWIYK